MVESTRRVKVTLEILTGVKRMTYDETQEVAKEI